MSMFDKYRLRAIANDATLILDQFVGQLTKEDSDLIKQANDALATVLDRLEEEN